MFWWFSKSCDIQYRRRKKTGIAKYLRYIFIERNKRTELVKIPKIYFLDHGFRNQCAGDFSINQQQIGQFYENFVFSEFLKKEIELKYWRTGSNAEVDFIKDEKIPIEIKTTPKVTRAFQSFIKKYQPARSWLCDF